MKLKEIWADSERALHELVAGCQEQLADRDLAAIKDFISANEHECAFHQICTALEEAGLSLPEHLMPFADRLKHRFYGRN